MNYYCMTIAGGGWAMVTPLLSASCQHITCNPRGTRLGPGGSSSSFGDTDSLEGLE